MYYSPVLCMQRQENQCNIAQDRYRTCLSGCSASLKVSASRSDSNELCFTAACTRTVLCAVHDACAASCWHPLQLSFPVFSPR